MGLFLYRKLDRQLESRNLSQLDLLLPASSQVEEISDAVIVRKPTLTAAIFLMIDVSGLTDDQVCGHLDIQPAQLSRCRKGQGHFPPDKLDDAMTLCGNIIPLKWQALRRDLELKPKLQLLERQLMEANEKADAAVAELNAIKRFVKETR
jgi:hypothetical protein